jgi:hypothetical protein
MTGGEAGPPPNLAGLTPGVFVRHPGRPDWGIGQVQSAIGNRVTVTFRHGGKVAVDAGIVALEIVRPDELDSHDI